MQQTAARLARAHLLGTAGYRLAVAASALRPASMRVRCSLSRNRGPIHGQARRSIPRIDVYVDDGRRNVRPKIGGADRNRFQCRRGGGRSGRPRRGIDRIEGVLESAKVTYRVRLRLFFTLMERLHG